MELCGHGWLTIIKDAHIRALVQEPLSRRRRNTFRSCTRDIDCLAIVRSQLRTSWAVCIMNTSWKSVSPDAVRGFCGAHGLLFHDLRRTGARNLRRAGVAEGVIQKIGGWKTRSVFERYAIVDQRDIADAMRN